MPPEKNIFHSEATEPNSERKSVGILYTVPFFKYDIQNFEKNEWRKDDVKCCTEPAFLLLSIYILHLNHLVDEFHQGGVIRRRLDRNFNYC